MKKYLAPVLFALSLNACAPQQTQMPSASEVVLARNTLSTDFGKTTLEEYSRIMGRAFSEQLAYIKDNVRGEVINDASRNEYGFRCQERAEIIDPQGNADPLIRLMKKYNALQKEKENGKQKNLLPKLAIVLRDDRQVSGDQEDFFYGRTYCEMFRDSLFSGRTTEKTGFPQEVGENGLLFSYDGFDPLNGNRVRYAYVFPDLKQPEKVIVYKFLPSEGGYISQRLDEARVAEMTRTDLLTVELDHILRKIIMKRTLEMLPEETQQELLE